MRLQHYFMKNTKAFRDLDKIIREYYINIAGIAVYQNDHMLYEQYFNGYDQADTIHIASATKSIVSLLIGIAIDKGYIADSVQAKGIGRSFRNIKSNAERGRFNPLLLKIF